MSKITSDIRTPQSDDEFSDWINTSEAAKILGVSQRWVTALLEEGRLDGRKLGPRFWWIKRSSVEEYRQQREQKD